MKTFEIPVYWEMKGIIKVDAETIEEAIQKFDAQVDKNSYQLSNQQEYVKDSFKREEDRIVKMLNRNV